MACAVLTITIAGTMPKRNYSTIKTQPCAYPIVLSYKIKIEYLRRDLTNESNTRQSVA